MGAWHFLVLSAGENPHAHKNSLFFWAGELEMGGEVPILFLWARGCFRLIEAVPVTVLSVGLRVDL